MPLLVGSCKWPLTHYAIIAVLAAVGRTIAASEMLPADEHLRHSAAPCDLG